MKIVSWKLKLLTPQLEALVEDCVFVQDTLSTCNRTEYLGEINFFLMQTM